MTRATDRTGPRALGLMELIAMGVGGMIGGGIFSVLGLAIGITGYAAPLAFAIGALIALAAGYSYIRLALTFRSDGASYTYLAKAFENNRHVSGITGWTVIVGYVGTLALYGFTFGAYGADLLNQPDNALLRISLSIAVLLFFLSSICKARKPAGIRKILWSTPKYCSSPFSQWPDFPPSNPNT